MDPLQTLPVSGSNGGRYTNAFTTKVEVVLENGMIPFPVLWETNPWNANGRNVSYIVTTINSY